MINKATSSPLGRAVVSFNFLACLMALAAAVKHVNSLPDQPEALWQYLLGVAMFASIVSLPFGYYLLAAFEGVGERMRYFVIVLNLVFSVFGAFNLYGVMLQQQALEAMPLFTIGLAPVALANAALLVFKD